MFRTANGGPPGLIFSLVVAGAYYSFIGLNLAEVLTSGELQDVN